MDPATTTALLQGAFQAIAWFRRRGATNAEINAAFDRADAGEDPVTLESVEAVLDEWQDAINEGRRLSDDA